MSGKKRGRPKKKATEDKGDKGDNNTKRKRRRKRAGKRRKSIRPP